MKTFFKTIAAVALGLGSVAATQAQTKWAVDNAHSSVKFVVTHMVISEVEGNFKTFTGNISAPSSDFVNAQIDFTVDVNSINTDNDARDKHLKSDDFFAAAKYPNMTFKSSSFKKNADGKYSLTGTLTIHGVSKTVTFDVVYGGTRKDPYGNIKSGFKATTTINRQDYGLTWSGKTEAGELMVSDDVQIIVKLEFAQQK